ncbi:MAG: hypothetical protein MRERV_1c103 [Mycoplasmataceae bacterium RV_VA103A]|nr:MAG: hypothetical protein MRERV_1c103 [Mycoplasmataceae bacterium RV_VA103A]
MIPVAGKALKKGVKMAKRGVGAWKDLQAGGGIDFGDLSSDIGDLKNGLAGAKAQIESQGKALQGQIEGVKSELEGALKQQGEKFDQEIKAQDAKIATLQGEQKKQAEETKKALQKQKQQLEKALQEVTQNLIRVQNQLRKELNDFKSEVNQRFAEQEQKILENKRKIEEEKRQREAEIREVKDKINVANAKVENLQAQKEELQDHFNKYQFQTNQKLSETQAELENTQAEFQSKIKLQEAKYQNDLQESQENFEMQTKIFDTKIKDTREALEEQEEELSNIKYEQKKSRIEQQQILEDLQETNDILHFQKHKLDFVANQMEEIHEEVHERMDKLSQKLEDRTTETLNIAKDTNKKVDKLTDEVKSIRQTTEQLQEQIQKNKEEAEKAKQEAKLANERLDNYIKSQSLMDFSAQQAKINKIQKSLQLKAEETKLLATLNFIRETKKIIPLEFSEREWKVGIKEGTEKEMPRPEGFPLKPDCSWAKKYTPEQLREWGWDTRLLGDNENAPLTDPEKRKPEQTQSNQQRPNEQEELNQSDNSFLEKFTELEKETLERLQSIQQEIRTGLEEIENTRNTSAKPPKPSAATSLKITETETKLKAAKKKLERKQQEEKKAQQQAQNQPSKPNQKQLEEAQQETKQAQQEFQAAQEQLASLESQQDFEESLESAEAKIKETKQNQVEREWSQIQNLSKQALQEQPEEEEEEKEQKEHDLNKKLEELTQQLKEMEQTVAASQKQMTKWMLYLIIFLLEYIVYKRNGLPGLIVLNVLLAIAYYYRDTLKEYAELWNKYLLIIGYIMGNVLAYSAPEQEKYKWPSVIGFNLAIAGIYAYTLYQQKQEKAKIETFYQQETKKICEENNITAEEWKTIQDSSQPSIIDEYNLFSNSEELKTQQLENLKTVIQIKEEVHQKELEIQKKAENLQKATEIEKKLKQAREGLGDSPMTWNKIYEKYPDFKEKSLLLKELEKADKYISQELDNENQAISPLLLNKLDKLPPASEEELEIISQLYLTVKKFALLASQAQYLSINEREQIIENFPNFSQDLKLKLINSGLNSLGINTLNKKEQLVELNHTLHQEKANFGLTLKEKENILRMFINELDLTKEQQQALEQVGVRFFNASEWVIEEDQKQPLLKAGLSRMILTEEQKGQLINLHPDTFRIFPLNEQQKNILQALAPLTREDKYSEDSLQLVGKLELKPISQNFLVNNEIIPNPNLDFGEVKSPYLPLKIKFLQGEQKKLRKEREAQEKQLRAEEILANKQSIITSLLEWYGNQDETQFNLNLEDYVKVGALKGWQRDILLTCGLKTIPRYHFWEILIFAVENFTSLTWQRQEISAEEKLAIEEYQTQILTILDTWKDNSQGTEKEAVRKVIKTLSNDALLSNQQYAELSTLLTKYPNNNIKLNNLVKAWGQINQKTLIPISAWEQFLQENDWLKEHYQEYLNSLTEIQITINKTIWEKYASSQKPKEREIFKDLNLEELINEKINQALAGYQPQEVFYDSKEELENQESEKTAEQTNTPSTSRYDDLLSNLDKEEAERQRKKLEREEARKKLEEAELKRREEKLSEKDRKLKEQEEQRKREKELAELEEKKRQEMKEAREKALREETEAHLANQQKIIEEQQQARQEAFNNQQKEAELAEEKKRKDIENLEKQNQFAKEQLEKQKELLEKETQEKLAKIAAEDEKERQKILKQQQEREMALENERRENERNLQDQKQRWEDELKKLKQNNEKELQEAKNKLDAEKKKAEEDLNRLKEEEKLAEQEKEKRKKELEKAKLLNKKKQAELEKEFEISKLQAKAWDELMNYSLGHDEVKFGTLLNGNPINYHFQKSKSRGGYVQMPTVKEIFQQYPGVKIKLVGVKDLKDKLVNDRPMTLEDVKNVAILAGEYPDFYTEEEWRQKIRELDKIGLLE